VGSNPTPSAIDGAYPNGPEWRGRAAPSSNAEGQHLFCDSPRV